MAAKIEKTLELNITHELLSLADSFWWYIQPVSLHRFWRPHWRFPIIPGPRSFATGLHINKEGKKGGGYDVCINSPANFQSGNARLLFMQFKAGVEQQFHQDKKSLFYGSPSKPSIHVEFDINSNAKNDQHRLLQQLAAKSGNEDAVVYVFPRIVNEKQLMENVGRLLTKTSFVSLSEIDKKATKAGVVIDDGNPHKFRTCYVDPDKSEVNRFFFHFGKNEKPGSYIGEIFAVRIFRALRDLQKVQLQDFPPYRNNIKDAFIRHLVTIANHLEISRESFYTNLMKFPGIMERFGYNDVDDTLINYTDDRNSKFNDTIFDDIVESMSVYLTWIEEEEYFDKRMKVPDPPQRVSIELPHDGIRFDGIDFDEDSIDEISYQLF